MNGQGNLSAGSSNIICRCHSSRVSVTHIFLMITASTPEKSARFAYTGKGYLVLASALGIWFHGLLPTDINARLYGSNPHGGHRVTYRYIYQPSLMEYNYSAFVTLPLLIIISASAIPSTFDHRFYPATDWCPRSSFTTIIKIITYHCTFGGWAGTLPNYVKVRLNKNT